MALSGSGSSRTPFDEDLVNDPQAPRDTQPLSPRASSAATPASPAAAPAPPPVVSRARHLPPQVVTGNLDDDAAAPAVPTGRLTRKLPVGTLVGGAMVAGALGVVLLSAIVSRVLPRPAPIVYTTEDGPTAPRVVMQRPASGGGVVIDADQPRIIDRSVATGDPSGEESATVVEAAPRSDTARRSARSTTGDGERSSAASSGDATDGAEIAGTSRDSDDDDPASSTRTTNSSSSERFTSRRGYAVTPPPGYQLRRTGRRTEWRGPNGEQFLVETGTAHGSPREGWERLNKALSKKYGGKYRNLGIRETIVAGKPAAVWEFEIDGPSGTQRKIDVAVHHGNTGYAVLGAASAERFEEVRPQIESAIRSLEVKTRSSASSSRSSADRARDEGRSRIRPESGRRDAPEASGRAVTPRDGYEAPTNTEARPRNNSGTRRDVFPPDTLPESDDTTLDAPVRSGGY